MRPHILLASAIAFCLSLGIPARAQDASNEARQQFQQAEAHYRLGRFEEALEEYTKAYELSRLPGFLFNIGQCHRQLGNHARAVFFFEGYLREKPDAKNRTQVEQILAASRQELDRAQAEKQRLEQEQRLRAEAERRAEEQHLQALALEQERLRSLAARDEQPAPAPPPPAEPAFYQRWWFWTVLGGVAMAAAGGTIFLLSSGETRVLPTGNLGTLDLRGL